MKKYILLVLSLTVLSLNITAQSVKGSLNNPQVRKMGDGVLVYGMNDDRIFKMLLYDKNLKLKKEFSKPLDKDVKKGWCSLQEKQGNFEVTFCNNMFCTYGSLLKVNEKLEEVSFQEYSKADKEKFKALLAESYKGSSVKDAEYVTKRISGANFSWGPHASDKEQIYDAALQIPGSNERIVIYKSYFDSTAGKFIAAGNYFEFAKKQKDRIMKGLAVLFMDDKKNILTIKKLEFPEYLFKEPGEFDFKDKQGFVNYLSKTKQGTYVLNCTNAAKKHISGGAPVRGGAVPQTTQGWDFYATVGFSYLELDSSLNQISSVFYPLEKVKEYQTATYGASGNEGKTLIFSNAKSPGESGPINSEIIFFSDSAKPVLKTNHSCEDFYSMNEIRNPPIPNQFLMDDHTLIIFVNKSGKDDYELKLVKF
jgi:hypothetical protein